LQTFFCTINGSIPHINKNARHKKLNLMSFYVLLLVVSLEKLVIQPCLLLCDVIRKREERERDGERAKFSSGKETGNSSIRRH
jgi:hypothetical protein